MDADVIDDTADQLYPILKSMSLAVHYDCSSRHKIKIDSQDIRISFLQLKTLVQPVPNKEVVDSEYEQSDVHEIFEQAVNFWGPKSLDKKVVEISDEDNHYRLRMRVETVSTKTALEENGQYVLSDPDSETVNDEGYFYVSKVDIKKGLKSFVCRNNDQDPNDIRIIPSDNPDIQCYKISTVSLNVTFRL